MSCVKWSVTLILFVLKTEIAFIQRKSYLTSYIANKALFDFCNLIIYAKTFHSRVILSCSFVTWACFSRFLLYQDLFVPGFVCSSILLLKSHFVPGSFHSRVVLSCSFVTGSCFSRFLLQQDLFVPGFVCSSILLLQSHFVPGSLYSRVILFQVPFVAWSFCTGLLGSRFFLQQGPCIAKIFNIELFFLLITNFLFKVNNSFLPIHTMAVKLNVPDVISENIFNNINNTKQLMLG